MSTLINKVLFTRAGYGLTILRIFVGIIFAAHGFTETLWGIRRLRALPALRSTWKALDWLRAM